MGPGCGRRPAGGRGLLDNSVDDQAKALLGSARVARLATVRRDGSPHVVPITFEVEDDRIVTTVDDKPKSTKRLARLDNIAFQSKVAVLADEYADDWERLWWVRADGTARVVAAGPELESAIDLLAAKYVQYRQMRPVGPAIVIDVERWVLWEASSGKGE